MKFSFSSVKKTQHMTKSEFPPAKGGDGVGNREEESRGRRRQASKSESPPASNPKTERHYKQEGKFGACPKQ